MIRDLAVMLADGGECVSDLGAVRDQEALFGPVASDSTAFRVIDRVACDPALVDALPSPHARARERLWGLRRVPEGLTIDVDERPHRRDDPESASLSPVTPKRVPPVTLARLLHVPGWVRELP